MTKFGYFLSCEEYAPVELLAQARLAQEVGFDNLSISDLFHPWTDTRDRAVRDHETTERLPVDLCTSPLEEDIDRTALQERCFPTVELKSGHILDLVNAGEDGVFIQYEYELNNGERHRNTEFIAVRNGRLAETQVCFGGRIDAAGDCPRDPTIDVPQHEGSGP